MVKKNIMISLDNKLWKKAKVKYPNKLSSMFNDYLKSVLAYEENDLTNINVELEHIKISELQEKSHKIAVELEESKKKIQLYETSIKDKLKENIEKQKQTIEKKYTCDNCGSFISGKIYDYNDRRWCNNCFMSI